MTTHILLVTFEEGSRFALQSELEKKAIGYELVSHGAIEVYVQLDVSAEDFMRQISSAFDENDSPINIYEVGNSVCLSIS